MSNSVFKCAVVGLGNMGAQHASVLARLPHVELAVCCDISADSQRRCPDGTRFTTSIADALDEPGLRGVVIATPEDHHRDAVVQALARGISVLCEKPLADTLGDIDVIVAAERSSAGMLAVGHIVRFDPRYRTVKDAVASGSLGRPVHITTRRNNSIIYGARLADRTSLPMYLSVHDIDIMEWIVGAPIVRVFAEGAATGVLPGSRDESVVATMRFANGAVATHEVSWVLPAESGFAAGDFAFSYIGTKGSAYIEIRSQGVSIYGGAGSGDSDTAEPVPDVRHGTVSYPATMFSYSIDTVPFGVLRLQLEHFIASTVSRRPPLVGSEAGRRAVVVALALEESLTTGTPIMIDAPAAPGFA